MNMQEIKHIAKDYGIKTTRMTKAQLIKQIQVAEGNFDCFATPVNAECDQIGCLWRDDCLTRTSTKSAS